MRPSSSWHKGLCGDRCGFACRLLVWGPWKRERVNSRNNSRCRIGLEDSAVYDTACETISARLHSHENNSVSYMLCTVPIGLHRWLQLHLGGVQDHGSIAIPRQIDSNSTDYEPRALVEYTRGSSVSTTKPVWIVEQRSNRSCRSYVEGRTGSVLVRQPLSEDSVAHKTSMRSYLSSEDHVLHVASRCGFLTHRA